jgi:hypothetical protein
MWKPYKQKLGERKKEDTKVKQSDPERKQVYENLKSLLDGDTTEEEIHVFLDRHSLLFRPSVLDFGEPFIQGVISKFPVTPDRIPDFTVAMLNVQRSQMPSRLIFVEIKRPSAKLYVDHGRMSKDLNDAWMECVETARLLGMNFRDCLRRIVKTLDDKRLGEFGQIYEFSMKRHHERSGFYMHEIPLCCSIIVIGRRSSLDNEELLRTQELSASSGRAIQVITYDTILDALEKEHGGFLDHVYWYW